MAVVLNNDELLALRARLKSGEYDGTDIMHAWLAIDELRDLRVAISGVDLLIEVARMPNQEFIADAHNATVRKLRTVAAYGGITYPQGREKDSVGE